MLHSFIQQDFATIIACVFLIVFILTNHSFEKRIDRLFLCTDLSVILLTIVDDVELWTKSWSEPSVLRILMSAIGYTLRPLCVLYIIAIIQRYNHRSIFWLSIPAAVNMLLSFSALFCPVMFSYDDANVFHRGPLGMTPFAVSIFYLIVMLVLTVSMFRDGNIHESFLTSIIVVISLSSTIMVSAFGFKGFLNISIIMSVIFYYLYLHTQKYKRDTLTNCLDRRCFYLDSQKILNSQFYVVSIDLNDLKKINDTKGHAAGDTAIKTLVSTVRKCIEKNCKLYRTGGDEFMMICHKKNNSEIEGFINKIHTHMSDTDYSCAIGYAEYNPGEQFDQICASADEAMYNCKRKMKAEVSNNTGEK